jgi:hypothetical protein
VANLAFAAGPMAETVTLGILLRRVAVLGCLTLRLRT